MERTMTIKKFFAPSTTRLGRQQWFRNVWQRLTVVLMLVMLTTATAWAQENTMTVTAEDVTVTYDGSEHYITVNVSVPKSGATITYCETENGTYTDTNPTYTNAGVNTVYYKVTASGYADYSGSATVTINKAPLTITANNKSINYGDAPANDGVTYSGFVNGENKDNLGGTLGFEYNYSQGDPVGTYRITPNGLTSENYDITFVSGTLTVDKKSLTVAANDITIDHGAAAPAYTYTVTGLVNGESLTTEPALSCDYAQGDAIGTYPISISGAAASANYTISYAPGTLTVQPKKYTVTFVDEDGTTVLKEGEEYEYGTAAADIVKPADPTKDATAQYTYTFAGWTPEIVAVTEDATYTATYSSTLRTNGYCGTDDPNTTDVDESKTVTWNYDTDSKTITISGGGPMMYYNSVLNGDQSYSNGAPWKAFAGEVEHVVISDGITYVGSNTFAHCPNISSVTLPTDQHLYEIGPGAFGDCTSLTSIDIPMSVNKINDGAFAGCSNLSTVTLGYGDGATFTIGTDVFPATTTIIVPAAALQSYLGADGWSAYADKIMSTGYCGKKIYNSEPPYDHLVADYTTNLIWTLSAIAKTTDQGMTLETVKVNNEDVPALKLTVSANTVNPVNTQAKGAFDMADVSTIQSPYVFPWSTGSDEHVLAIRDVVIEDGVTSIGSSAFRFPFSGKITNATIGKDVKTIGDEAFRGTKLANVTFAENSTLEDIRYNAFNNTDLTDITIPASVKSISNAFQYCDQLATVTFEDSPARPSQLTSIGGNAFQETKIATITLPKGVTYIGPEAFLNCTALETVNFAEDATLELIDIRVFQGCTALQSVTIPASVKWIYYSAFQGCTSLASVNFAEGSALEEVHASAFDGCTTLTQNDYVLNLPATVTDVFADDPTHLLACVNAKLWNNATEKLSYSNRCGVEVLNYETETIINSQRNVQFTLRSNGTQSDGTHTLGLNIYKNEKDAVGMNFSMTDYENADDTRWADVRTSITVVEVGEGVTGIGNNAFGGCSALKTFRVKPTTAPALGTNVFDGCTALTDIIAPANYKTADGWQSAGIVEKLRADREDLFTGGTEWMTWCGDFDWSAPAGCNVYVVSDVGENTVTLTALTETANADRTEGEENAEGIRIPAYTPVILQKTVANATGLQARFAKVGTVPTSGYNATTGLVTKTETGFSMLGAAKDAPVSGSITAGYSYALFDGEFLKIDDSTLDIPAHRCILTLPEPLSASRLHININGEATSLSEAKEDSSLFTLHSSLSGWYTLDGRKLDKQPTTKGLYIYKGKKVVIK